SFIQFSPPCHRRNADPLDGLRAFSTEFSEELSVDLQDRGGSLRQHRRRTWISCEQRHLAEVAAFFDRFDDLSLRLEPDGSAAGGDNVHRVSGLALTYDDLAVAKHAEGGLYGDRSPLLFVQRLKNVLPVA